MLTKLIIDGNFPKGQLLWRVPGVYPIPSVLLISTIYLEPLLLLSFRSDHTFSVWSIVTAVLVLGIQLYGPSDHLFQWPQSLIVLVAVDVIIFAVLFAAARVAFAAGYRLVN
ncbi:MAG: hypothetical protein KDB27_04125 [Planctomycetales bacterium]|nr:hypothetical protein [Planctomycetales bacterium]